MTDKSREEPPSQFEYQERPKEVPLSSEVGKPVSAAPPLEIPAGEVAIPQDIEVLQATTRKPLAKLMDQTKLAAAQVEISKAGEASEIVDPASLEEKLEAYFKSKKQK